MHTCLADHVGQRTNRIDHIRLGAAIAVVFGHSWHLSRGPDAVAPLEPVLGLGIHELAVHVFFFLSGLLITQSALRHQSRPLKFAFARLKRILPALWVHAIVLPAALVLLGVVAVEDAQALLRYAVRLMSVVFVEFTLPDVFANNPFPDTINGSVWSLRHELVVYGLVGGAGALGMLRSAWGVTAFALVVGVWIGFAHALVPKATDGLAFIFVEGRWVMASFLLGVLCHRAARFVSLRVDMSIALWIIAGVALVALPSLLATHAVLVALCYSTLIVAFAGAPKGGLRADLSYGIYIYGWPVQQGVVMACIQAFEVTPSPLMVFALAMPPLVLIAGLSWHVIEQPALKLTFPFDAKRTDPPCPPILRHTLHDTKGR